MTKVQAYAAQTANGLFTPFEYTLGPIHRDEVDIAVESCGICHSDLSMLENAWGLTQFPLVPGHEIIGKVSSVGGEVHHLRVGDRVGLGWHAGYCTTCDQCLGGHHNLCFQAEATVVGRHGGFADLVRAKAVSVTQIPDTLDHKKAGPLLCGGMAVFNPLMQFEISPTAHIGVIGIGGLGHLALQFAKAWGCHVTAFTSTESKQAEALQLGASDTIHSRDPDEIKQATGRFDLLLSTVNVNLDWNSYLATLKPRGRLHLLGAVTDPLKIQLLPMLFGQLSLSASPVGSPLTIRKMLSFAAQHNILPLTEHFPMSDVNQAFDRLRSGQARYRIVLDRT